MRESTSSRAAGWESSSRTMSERFRCGAAHDERDSRSSGRSTSIGSAQWTSSTTATKGWSRATASNRRRTAQKVSSGGADSSESPIVARSRLATSSASS